MKPIHVMAFIWCALGTMSMTLCVASAHEAPSGWFYDAACCSNKDCAPIDDAEVEESDAGFFLKTRQEFVPREKTKQGRDENFHLCVNQFNGSLLCFYRKFSGS